MVRIVTFKFLTVAAYGLMYLLTSIMVLISLPFVYFRIKPAIKSLIRFWARSILFLAGKKLHISGAENVSRDLHYILVANHSSLFDIVAIASVVPDIAWFGHERLLKIPFFRRVLILTDYIPMRKTGIRNTREMVSCLVEKSKTHNIAIFPEGTRTLNGKINDFYRGFILLMKASEIDILPITLNGFYDLKPKNRFWIDFGSTLEMVIHKPIPRKDIVDKNDNEIAAIVRSVLESASKK